MTQDPTTHRTVLIVDDEPDLRDIMRRMLERKGFAILTAGDADQAIAACKEHEGDIDLLVADLGMPGTSGGDVARSATALRPDMRVIFVSGLPKAVALDNGLITAESLLLQKPFNSTQLVEAVTAALEND